MSEFDLLVRDLRAVQEQRERGQMPDRRPPPRDHSHLAKALETSGPMLRAANLAQAQKTRQAALDRTLGELRTMAKAFAPPSPPAPRITRAEFIQRFRSAVAAGQITAHQTALIEAKLWRIP